jgi:deazaflavin-dependent oxidoreductase (nitroreductase family)
MHSEVKRYRVGLFVRFDNAVMRRLLRSGVRIGTFAVLTVRGRKTGRPVSVPLVVFPYDGQRHLVASYGIVNWVRNLRAAGGRAELRRGRNVENVVAQELSPDEAGPVLSASLRAGPPGIPRPIVRLFRRYSVLPYLEVDMESSAEEFVRAARNHPVFSLDPPMNWLVIGCRNEESAL